MKLEDGDTLDVGVPTTEPNIKHGGLSVVCSDWWLGLHHVEGVHSSDVGSDVLMQD